jgi:WD40 repeat protein
LVSTVEAARALAAGHTVAGTVSANVAALLKGGIKATFAKKLMTGTVLLLAGIVIGGVLLRPPVAGDEGEQVQQNGRVRVFNLESRGRRVAWSPDGKTLAVVTKNETLFNRKGSAIKLWDVEKGLERATLAEDADVSLSFQQVAFSADGKMIAATVSDREGEVTKVWDAKTLEVQQTLADKSQMVHVAFSPDSKLLAICDPTRKSAKLWDPVAGTLERTLDTGAEAWYAAFSPDGKTVVVGGQKADHSGVVTLWDVKTGKLQHTLFPEKYVNGLAFSPDGKMVASSDGGELIQVWGVEEGDEIVSIKGNKRSPRTITFVAGGKMIAEGGRDGKVRLWDIRTGKLHETLAGHTAEVYSIALSPDGKTLASVSQDQTLRLWPVGRKTNEPK